MRKVLHLVKNFGIVSECLNSSQKFCDLSGPAAFQLRVFAIAFFTSSMVKLLSCISGSCSVLLLIFSSQSTIRATCIGLAHIVL